MPDKSQKERTKIVKGMWENLGRVIGEYPHLKKLVIKKKNSRIFIKGKKNLLLIDSIIDLILEFTYFPIH